MGPQQHHLARRNLVQTTVRNGLLALLLAMPLAHAGEDGPSVDIAAGRQRAAVCFACHNANGISQMPGTPNLAGQDRSYLENALRDYRGGQDRKNAIMNAMAQPLSDQDIADIAAYFNSLPRSGDRQPR